VLGVGLAAATLLRFIAPSDLWLDEALSVNIAKLPLDQLRNALAHDGAPPLYYVLLHGWIGIFGSSSVAVRSLSGIFGVAAVGLAYLAGRRLGRTRSACRWLGISAMIVVGVSPYAIHYASEARMYSLAMVLVLLGVIIGIDAWTAPSAARLAAITLVTVGLLMTQYWSFFLLVPVTIGLVLVSLRGVELARHSARRLLLAVLVGGVLFLPWVPTMRTQLAHTGTPWDSPTSPIGATVKTVVAFGGGRTIEGWPQIVVLVGLAALGVVTALVGVRGRAIEPSTAAAAVMVVGAGTLVVGIGYATIAGLGFQDRYAALVFPLFALTVAAGVVALHDIRLRVSVLVVIAVLGLLGGLRVARAIRTPSGRVAAALTPKLRPADLVVYCPDQLGPPTARLLSARTRQGTFPRLAPPEFVDWTDYADRNRAASVRDFAGRVDRRAGTGRIWLVWSPGYRTLGTKCESVINALGELRTPSDLVMAFDGPVGETVEVRRFDP
jgi:Predicted membrane protein